MSILSKDAILGAQDLKEELVHVPEWGGEVKIRALTLAQRNRAYKLAERDGQIDSSRAAAFMFVAGVIEPPFNEADIDPLRNKCVGVIDRVNARILALSGLTKEAGEDLAKNSESAPTGS